MHLWCCRACACTHSSHTFFSGSGGHSSLLQQVNCSCSAPGKLHDRHGGCRSFLCSGREKHVTAQPLSTQWQHSTRVCCVGIWGTLQLSVQLGYITRRQQQHFLAPNPLQLSPDNTTCACLRHNAHADQHSHQHTDINNLRTPDSVVMVEATGIAGACTHCCNQYCT